MATRRIQWLAVALPALTVGLFEFLRHRWLEPALPYGLGNLLGALLVAIGVLGFVRLFAGMIQRAQEDLARARAEAAVNQERQRIAREMHDGVAQALFFLSVKLHGANRLVAEGQLDQAHAELQSLAGHLHEASAQIRQVIADLKRQEERSDFGALLQAKVAQMAAQLALRADCTVSCRPPLMAAGAGHVLAIVQEAMTNAHRHGQTRRINVRLEPAPPGCLLIVADDGSGFDPEAPRSEASFGLTIMAERAQLAGGHLRVESSPGQGTRVLLHLAEGSP